jgi:hypothetical protein
MTRSQAACLDENINKLEHKLGMEGREKTICRDEPELNEEHDRTEAQRLAT